MAKEEEADKRVDRLLWGSMGTLGFGIFLVVRMQNNSIKIARSSAYVLAGKALLMGTLISVSSVGLATALIAKYLQVSTFREFGSFARKHLEGLAPPSEAELEKSLSEKFPTRP